MTRPSTTTVIDVDSRFFFYLIWQRSCTINNRAATVAAAGSLGAGLSVSHDSVFGLDISPESDAYFTHHRNQPAAESLPSSASFQYMVNKIQFTKVTQPFILNQLIRAS